jgi:hypothetical protein
MTEKLIRDFKEMMEYNRTSPFSEPCPKEKAWHKSLMETRSYLALIASLDKPEEKKPQKQTLVDFALEKHGVLGVRHLEADIVISLISDWAEENLQGGKLDVNA